MRRSAKSSSQRRRRSRADGRGPRMARRHAVGPADAASHGPSPRARPQGGLDRGRLLRPHDHRPLLRDAGPHCRRRPHHAEARPGRAPLSSAASPVTKLEILHPHGVLDSHRCRPPTSPPFRRYGPVTMPWPSYRFDNRRNHEPRLHRRRHEGDAATSASASWIGEAALRQPSHPLVRGRAAPAPRRQPRKGPKRTGRLPSVAQPRSGQASRPEPVITFDATELNKMFADLFSKPLLTELPEVSSLPSRSTSPEFEATNLKLAGASPVVIDELRLDASMKASEVEIRRLDLKMPKPRAPQRGAHVSGKWAARPACEHQALRRARARREGRRDARGRGHGQVSLAAVAERSRARQVPACGRSPPLRASPFSVTLVSQSQLPLEGANPADLTSLSAFSLRMSGDVRN